MSQIVMSLCDLRHTGIIRMFCFNKGPAPGVMDSQTQPFRRDLHGVLLKLQNDGVREMQLSTLSWADWKRLDWAHSGFALLNRRAMH
jgi:hypothetical protein